MFVTRRPAAGVAFRSLRQYPRASSASPQPSRPYHSYDHLDSTPSFRSHEQTILSAAYKHVPEHGFSYKALALGARDTGYLDISTSVLPDGPFSLIRYHLVTRREGLAAKSSQVPGGSSQTGVQEKVERLTWERLLENEPIIDRWQEVAQSSFPACFCLPSCLP
ncbi:Ubiquinone biosynthesis protein coq9, mitochondrial [Colletotrichum higginsianum]|uniref:Ubiquinone biosynthesis protein n=1 Tax=Colletotrichum higginsianum TaxID=80884 RepID=A0A4T0WCT8_9PEZI|nr:Ubiquinone biosynthesis protein coq9, mitochondrial [Colletotrichum higginsianum]